MAFSISAVSCWNRPWPVTSWLNSSILPAAGKDTGRRPVVTRPASPTEGSKRSWSGGEPDTHLPRRLTETVQSGQHNAVCLPSVYGGFCESSTYIRSLLILVQHNVICMQFFELKARNDHDNISSS